MAAGLRRQGPGLRQEGHVPGHRRLRRHHRPGVLHGRGRPPGHRGRRSGELRHHRRRGPGPGHPRAAHRPDGPGPGGHPFGHHVHGGQLPAGLCPDLRPRHRQNLLPGDEGQDGDSPLPDFLHHPAPGGPGYRPLYQERL